METTGYTIYLMGKFNPGEFHPGWLTQSGVENNGAGVIPRNISISDDYADFSISTTRYTVNRTVFQISDNNITIEELLEKLKKLFIEQMSSTPASALNIQVYSHIELDNLQQWSKINNLFLTKCPWQKNERDFGLTSLKTYSTESIENYILTKFVTVERSQYLHNGAYVSTDFYFQFNQFLFIKELIKLLTMEIRERYLEAGEIFKTVKGIK